MSGITPPFFLQTYHLPSGGPLSGGKLYFYIGGSTSLPKDVYGDVALTLPLTQPVILDAAGTAPQYYFESGIYKIVVKDSNDVIINTRDYIEGAGGGGSGSDSYTVKTNASDVFPGFLVDKIQNSSTVTWSILDVGGNITYYANVNNSGLLDYKVKASGADATPGYLSDKISTSSTIKLEIVADKIKGTFVGAPYVPAAGGTFTGPVVFGNTVMATGGCFFGETIISGGLTVADPSTFNNIITNDINAQHIAAVNMSLTGLAGPGAGIIAVDAGGTLYRVDGAPFQVKYDINDTIPGYLGTKLVASTGITITTTTDNTNGTVMHIGSTVANWMDTTSTPKNMAISVGSSNAVNTLETINYLAPGTYQVLGDLYVELTVTSGTVDILASADGNPNGSPAVHLDGYTAYSESLTPGFHRAYLHIDNLFYAFQGPQIWLNYQLTGAFTGAVAWGHLSMIRIA